MPSAVPILEVCNTGENSLLLQPVDLVLFGVFPNAESLQLWKLAGRRASQLRRIRMHLCFVLCAGRRRMVLRNVRFQSWLPLLTKPFAKSLKRYLIAEIWLVVRPLVWAIIIWNISLRIHVQSPSVNTAVRLLVQTKRQVSVVARSALFVKTLESRTMDAALVIKVALWLSVAYWVVWVTMVFMTDLRKETISSRNWKCTHARHYARMSWFLLYRF